MIMELFVKSSGVERRRGAAEDRKPEGFEKILGARILLAEDNEIIAMTADAMTIREANGKTSIIMENYYRTFPKDYDKTINLYIKLNWDINERRSEAECPLPEMDGYEATEEIRKDEGYKDLPIVAMTPDAMTGAKELQEHAARGELSVEELRGLLEELELNLKKRQPKKCAPVMEEMAGHTLPKEYAGDV